MPLNFRNQRTILRIAWILPILVLAGWLRFADLGERPVHFDEATGAQILADRLEQGIYHFDPQHFHGPMLTDLAEPWCGWNGEKDWSGLQILTLRQVTALCGFLTVIGAALLGMGGLRSLFAAAFVATSPLLVYYARMFIHEAVFVMWVVPALGGFLLLKTGRHRWAGAVFLGAGIGAMAATRETVAVSLIAWGAALGLYWTRCHLRPSWKLALKNHHPRLLPLLAGATAALVVIFLAYTSLGREPREFITFFRTYIEYQPVGGHEKPLHYYLALLVWPEFRAGRLWTEGLLLVLALCVYTSRRDSMKAAAGRFFLEAGLLHLLIFSLIAYKTPWLASIGWFHICIAAAFGARNLVRLCGRSWQPAAVLLIFLITAWHGLQAYRAAFVIPSDGRNPYAYVPTSPDVERLAEFLLDLRSVGDLADAPLAVIGPDYWPLPWYLRGAGPTGYWPEGLPPKGNQLPVLLLMPGQWEAAVPQLENSHIFLPWGLRDENPLLIAIRRDVWAGYQDGSDGFDRLDGS